MPKYKVFAETKQYFEYVIEAKDASEAKLLVEKEDQAAEAGKVEFEGEWTITDITEEP